MIVDPPPPGKPVKHRGISEIPPAAPFASPSFVVVSVQARTPPWEPIFLHFPEGNRTCPREEFTAVK